MIIYLIWKSVGYLECCIWDNLRYRVAWPIRRTRTPLVEPPVDLISLGFFDETSEGRAICLGANNDVGGEVGYGWKEGFLFKSAFITRTLCNLTVSYVAGVLPSGPLCNLFELRPHCPSQDYSVPHASCWEGRGWPRKARWGVSWMGRGEGLLLLQCQLPCWKAVPLATVTRLCNLNPTFSFF
ncbi:hypothetical protein BJV78DRAFT_1178635, partial [Lactifluus subvellereus]